MIRVPGKPHLSRLVLFRIAGSTFTFHCWQCVSGFRIGLGLTPLGAYLDWRHGEAAESTAEAEARGSVGFAR